MPQQMKMKEFKKALLVAMLRKQREIGLNNYFDPKAAVDREGLAYQPGQIWLCVNDFHRSGYLLENSYISGEEDEGIECSLTASGIEYAEELEAATPELNRSNRFVRLADQSTEIASLRAQVAELTKLINENRENSFTDKEGVLAELAVLDLLLTQPQVSVPLIDKIVSETMIYLSKTFADQSIGIIATGVIASAATIFGLSLVR